MTYDEADKAVEAAMEHRDDRIYRLLDAYVDDKLSEVTDALEELLEAQNAVHDALDVWGPLDDAKKQEEATHAA